VITLNQFNDVDADTAATLVRPCLDVERWVRSVVTARPFASHADLLEHAAHAAEPLTPEEIGTALSHHPRIGERAGGTSAEAGLSRGEQSGLDLEGDVQSRLAAGNREYERTFGRVFLIRAAGRSSDEILAELHRRLDNDNSTEEREVSTQLLQIAVLRLSGAVQP